jgi:hypothetical protein
VVKHVCLSHTTIRRIWLTLRLQSHRQETFRLSKKEPLLVPKARDIVERYMNPR